MPEIAAATTEDLALRLQMAERRVEDLYDRIRRLEAELRSAGARAALFDHKRPGRR